METDSIKKLTLEVAIEEVIYLQWSLKIGGMVPDAAKSRIDSILSKFNSDEVESIKKSVEDHYKNINNKGEIS
jgi:hypothetical protein